MKVEIKIPDEAVVKLLKRSIRNCILGSLPKTLPMKEHTFIDLASALEYGKAANKVIEHWGGVPVDLASIQKAES